MQGLLDRLAALPEPQFQRVLLELSVAPSVLSSEAAPRLQRAVELIRYFQQPGRDPTTIEEAIHRLRPTNAALLPTLPNSASRRRLWLSVAALFVLLGGAGAVWHTLRPTGSQSRLSPVEKLRYQDDMVLHSGGQFLMGSRHDEIAALRILSPPPNAEPYDAQRETPAREVWVSPFLLSRYEITNQDFVRWLNDLSTLKVEPRSTLRGQVNFLIYGELTILKLDPQTQPIHRANDRWNVAAGRGDLPVVLVTWDGAQAFCREHHGSLPSEAQWEFAARGVERREFPWGSTAPDCTNVVIGRYDNRPCSKYPHNPASVRASTEDRTASGIYALGGNVREWVLDVFRSPYPECSAPCIDPVQTVADPMADRVIRGGGYWEQLEMARAARRGHDVPSRTDRAVGFRCAAAPPATVRE